MEPNYIVSADGVEFHHHYCGVQRLEGADPASFTVLGDPTTVALVTEP